MILLKKSYVIPVCVLIASAYFYFDTASASYISGNSQPSLIETQEETSKFLKLNVSATILANDVMKEVIKDATIPPTNLKDLEHNEQLLESYKPMINNNNSIFKPLENNTLSKIKLAEQCVHIYLRHPYKLSNEDISQLNNLTNQYRKIATTDNAILIDILRQSGMKYEIEPNGQINYWYMKKS